MNTNYNLITFKYNSLYTNNYKILKEKPQNFINMSCWDPTGQKYNYIKIMNQKAEIHSKYI